MTMRRIPHVPVLAQSAVARVGWVLVALAALWLAVAWAVAVP